MVKIIEIEINGVIHNVYVSKKRIKSLRLKINTSNQISLSIPTFYNYTQAIDFLNSKQAWISKVLNKYNNINNTNKCDFTNGSKILIWGIERQIMIFEATKNDVILTPQTLNIYSKNISTNNVYQVFYKWAKSFFYGHLIDMVEIQYKSIFKRLKVEKPQIVIKSMKSMWGNCKYEKKVVTLNVYLFKAPIECVNYVILHELAHLIYHNHGQDFKDFLTKYMPDWKTRKKTLSNFSLQF